MKVFFLAAFLGIAPAQASSLNCTPPALREFVRYHKLTVVSSYRRGARIRGKRRASLHSYCDKRRGAVDVKWKRGIIRAALSKGFGVITYARCTHHWHIHLSVGGNEHRHHIRCRSRSRR